MLSRITIFIFMIFFFLSCQNKAIDPEGIWVSSLGDGEVIIQKNRNGIAIRKKDKNKWSEYSYLKDNIYFGHENFNVIIEDEQNLFFKDKESEKKYHYKKTSRNVSALYSLNLYMPKEKVEKFMGPPDTIVKIKRFEKWFYGENTVVTLDELGVRYFSDFYKLNPQFDSLKIGMSLKKAYEFLGTPDGAETNGGNPETGVLDIWYYHQLHRHHLQFRDSILELYIPNTVRNTALSLFNTDAPIREFDFPVLDSTITQVTVNENGKTVDTLKARYRKFGKTAAGIKFYGKKYWLTCTMREDNQYRASYSRMINDTLHKEGNFKSIHIGIDPDFIAKGKLLGKIDARIEEKNNKDDIRIQGQFLILPN